jgi:DNA-binding FadR family transcriptional regulator
MDNEQRLIVTNRVIALIKGNSIAIGQRLPGERRLAEMYGSCRNTIREVLKHLETQGYVEIRKRSGCYVICKEDRPDWNSVKASDTGNILQVIQAIAIVGPTVTKMTTESCSKTDMADLNQVTARIGQAIVDHGPGKMIQYYARFYALAAELVGNRYLSLLMRELETGVSSVEAEKTTIAEKKMELFFAAHVELVNAMFRHDASATYARAQESIAAFGRLFVQTSDTDSSL